MASAAAATETVVERRIRPVDWHVAEVETRVARGADEHVVRELHVFRVSGADITEQVVHVVDATDEATPSGVGSENLALLALGALAMAELAAGDPEKAATRLAPVAATVVGSSCISPDVLALVPDTVEALLGAGRTDEAGPLVGALQRHAARRSRSWVGIAALRCRAMMLAAAGGTEEALALLDRAIALHVPGARYERARTLLTRARLLRRSNRRRDARDSLEEAVELFDAVGADRWTSVARAELGRLGLQPGDGIQLTPTERHVAVLIGSGRTVREAAAVLIVSPKTVEAHLTRVYRKLGIRSRAQLGRWMAAHSSGGDRSVEA